MPDPELLAKLERLRAPREKGPLLTDQNLFNMYYRPREVQEEEPATPPASNNNNVSIYKLSKNFKPRKWAIVGSNTSKARPFRTPRKGRKTRKARKSTSS